MATRKKFEYLELNTLASRALFNSFDIDGGGTINGEEGVKMISTLYDAATPREVAMVLRVIDSDGSDKITFSEFIAWWQDFGLQNHFALHDKDGVGDVSWECYIGMLVSMGVPETGQQLMKTMFPEDHDRLSYIDFHEWWREFDDNISFEKFDEDGSGELALNEIKLLLLAMGLDIEGTPYLHHTHYTLYNILTIHYTPCS
jgi:Ca2+-binding EF-hand superfamily protein